MKNIFLIIATVLLFFSCEKYDKSILGEWKTKSKFHSAAYKIFEENDSLKGLVLHYNDGTSKYKFDRITPRYFFTNLEKKKDVYVDGSSGATLKENSNHGLKIKIKNSDSLEVTTYVMNQPIIEYWTKK